MAQKSILEQALLQVETLEEAVKANAKGILASTMKQELNGMLKEQEDENPEDEEKDVEGAEPTDSETSDDTLDNELPSDVEDETSTEDKDELPAIGDEIPSDEDSDDVLDMTGASEEEVLKVFKAMKPEDGIVVKKEGNNLELSDEDNEYIIKLDSEEAEEDSNEFPEGLDEQNEPAEKDEIVYEIELDDTEESEPKEEAVPGLKKPVVKEPKEEAVPGLKKPVVKEPKEEAVPGLKKPVVKEPKEEECKECGDNKIEATEAARTKWNIHGDKGGSDRTGIKSKKIFKAGSTPINEELETLRSQNAEYKKALILFKDKLNEVAVFNANLAYATRLFTEHSTTKQEKLNILKRFDSISTITESKNLYGSIKGELETKKPITETVAEKIISTPQSSSTEVLSEAKAYENPQFKRMKDLMNKLK